MNENYTRSDFLEDDMQTRGESVDGEDQNSMNSTVLGGDRAGRAELSGSSIRELAVAKTIAVFELTMLVLTGRNLTMVERSPDQ